MKSYSDSASNPEEIDFMNFQEQVISEEISVTNATEYLAKYPDDSLKNNLLFKISYHYYKERDSLKFRFWNTKTFELSKKLKDTAKIGESYWDLAGFFNNTNVYDSSYIYYTKAQKAYQNSGARFESSRMLLNLALLQSSVKDYIGSEATTIEAIRTFKSLNKYKQLYISYNNLGIINNELKFYQKSLFYHGKALEMESIINNSILKASTLNNIGVVHRNNSDFQKSIEFYNKAFETDSLFIKNPRLFAMLLDNKAYSRFKLKDTVGLDSLFNESLHIRDSIEHIAGIITNKLHLGEYYLYSKNYEKAFKEANDAKLLSKEYDSFGDQLESLLLLSKIDTLNAGEHYKKYITISDSLQYEERAIRNKFARIRFETDEFIEENKLLSERNKWVIAGSSSILVFILLLYFLKMEKNRNRELILERKQQSANEEIYNLLMDQQNKLDAGRKLEKERISKELHDGVLSKMFGIRLMLDSLNGKSDIKSIESRKEYIYELNSVEKEVRNISHDLQSELFSTETSFIQLINELLNKPEISEMLIVSLKNDGNIIWNQISSKIKINLYRIIQEAIQNVRKYADASELVISFSKKNLNLILIITDDGQGFNSKILSEGIGLSNMKSRVKSLDGKIKIESALGLGTEIIIKIPSTK